MICANKTCEKIFDPKTHNQKYCSDECCRIATNKKIMEKYYEKKAIRSGTKRQCKKCKVLLSRYNSQDICSSCEKKYHIDNKEKILRMLRDVSDIG
jgi:hypothetical protein